MQRKELIFRIGLIASGKHAEEGSSTHVHLIRKLVKHSNYWSDKVIFLSTGLVGLVLKHSLSEPLNPNPNRPALSLKLLQISIKPALFLEHHLNIQQFSEHSLL